MISTTGQHVLIRDQLLLQIMLLRILSQTLSTAAAADLVRRTYCSMGESVTQEAIVALTPPKTPSIQIKDKESQKDWGTIIC